MFTKYYSLMTVVEGEGEDEGEGEGVEGEGEYSYHDIAQNVSILLKSCQVASDNWSDSI